MGYMRHHAILITSWDTERLAIVHKEIVQLAGEVFGVPQLVSEIVPSVINVYGSFFVAPDGSKEGWGDSDKGDEFRERVVALLRAGRYEDGSTSLDWAEVRFGDEDGENRLLRTDGDTDDAPGDL